MDWPETKRLAGVPVVTRWLRRVVWKARDDDRYRPGTLFYPTAGRSRFGASAGRRTSVRAAVGTGNPRGRIRPDRRAASAAASPVGGVVRSTGDAASRRDGICAQVETGDGVRATTATGGSRPPRTVTPGNRTTGITAFSRPGASNRCGCRIEGFACGGFSRRTKSRCRRSNRSRSVQRANLAGGWNFELDRNVHAWPMRCADHAVRVGLWRSRLQRAGLRSAGRRANVSDAVWAGSGRGRGGACGPPFSPVPRPGRPLHRSEHVIGSAKSHDTGPLSVAGATQLTLVVDPAQDDRPRGADPFEIRDSFDWLQPIVELDPEVAPSGTRTPQRIAPVDLAGMDDRRCPSKTVRRLHRVGPAAAPRPPLPGRGRAAGGLLLPDAEAGDR